MRTRTARLALTALAMAALVGCAHNRPRRLASAEPPLLTEEGPDTVIVEAPRARSVRFADRHPLLTRPREYYDTTNGNKLSKSAAAAVIGVPSGLGAEIKQIVVGRPPGA